MANPVQLKCDWKNVDIYNTAEPVEILNTRVDTRRPLLKKHQAPIRKLIKTSVKMHARLALNHGVYMQFSTKLYLSRGDLSWRVWYQIDALDMRDNIYFITILRVGFGTDQQNPGFMVWP